MAVQPSEQIRPEDVDAESGAPAPVQEEQFQREALQVQTGRSIRLRVNRGEPGDDVGRWEEYDVPLAKGMVVLDAVLYVQAHESPDLAARWNCKAAKCGSCSAEINGRPRLQCKTRVEDLPLEQPITVEPLKTFPRIKDLVTDVSWNYEVNKTIKPFSPKYDPDDKEWNFPQRDVERAQEMRKCIECFLCQDVCHVLRYQREIKPQFAGPRYFVRTAGLDYHPMDDADRLGFLAGEGGVEMCNITKCCTEVCPEHIHITDNAIIPEKERLVDAQGDPFKQLWRSIFGPKSGAKKS